MYEKISRTQIKKDKTAPFISLHTYLVFNRYFITLITLPFSGTLAKTTKRIGGIIAAPLEPLPNHQMSPSGDVHPNEIRMPGSSLSTRETQRKTQREINDGDITQLRYFRSNQQPAGGGSGARGEAREGAPQIIGSSW